LAWVLDRDTETLPYLFPNGIATDAVATDRTLNARETPIALPLPDWNQWLPEIHPKDAWGDSFLQSRLFTRYAGDAGEIVSRVLRTELSRQDAGRYLSSGSYSQLRNDLSSWSLDRADFLKPRTQVAGIPWSPEYSEKVYSTARWQLVKLWELMQEFRLEGYAPLMFGANAEARMWFSNVPFQVAPHKLKIPIGENGIDGSALKTVTLSSAWYHLQIVLNSGARQHVEHDPVDWAYVYGHLDNLFRLSGSPEAMRLTLSVVKAMQNTDNGIGPENPSRGWSPLKIGDVARLVSGPLEHSWKEMPADVRAAVMQAVLGAWLEKSRSYAPEQYYQGRLADPEYVPSANPNGQLADRIWYMIPRYRRLGVDGALLDRICDWAATVWPKANWDSLR
jgi:hypothetical protein